MTLPAQTAVMLRVTEVLTALGVPHMVAGSVASALHGVYRVTAHADIVAALERRHIEPLVAALSESFYIDAESIAEALAARRSFNLIDFDTMFKIDVFVTKQTPFARQVLARRQAHRVAAEDDSLLIYVASAEDTVLSKLEWYRRGGETSERQWTDVQGVLKVQAGRLDLAYLRQWALELGVADLLEDALAQAARPLG